MTETNRTAISHSLDSNPDYDSFRGHADQVFGGLTFAQSGEDLIIANLFHRIGIKRPSYLDIGAHHPINISNTALFYLRGSRGVNVEANPHLIAEFTRLRPDDVNVSVGVSDAPGEMPFYMIGDRSGRNTFSQPTVEAFIRDHPKFSIRQCMNVKVTTINALVDEHCGGIFPDLLTIDVEGFDARILKSADFERSKPAIICAEETDATGAVITPLLRDRGFSLAFQTHSSTIYTRDRA